MEEVISDGHDRWISHSEDGHRIQAHVSHRLYGDGPQSGLFGASELRSDKHSADGDFTGFAENQLDVFLSKRVFAQPCSADTACHVVLTGEWRLCFLQFVHSVSLRWPSGSIGTGLSLQTIIHCYLS